MPIDYNCNIFVVFIFLYLAKMQLKNDVLHLITGAITACISSSQMMGSLHSPCKCNEISYQPMLAAMHISLLLVNNDVFSYCTDRRCSMPLHLGVVVCNCG